MRIKFPGHLVQRLKVKTKILNKKITKTKLKVDKLGLNEDMDSCDTSLCFLTPSLVLLKSGFKRIFSFIDVC